MHRARLQRTINLQHGMPTIETNLVARGKPSPGVTPIVSEGGQEQSRPQSEGAYPAYLFSYWADSAQDPYKRPLSRAVGKRRDLQKSLGGHSEAGKQEKEKRYFAEEEAEAVGRRAASMAQEGRSLPKGHQHQILF